MEWPYLLHIRRLKHFYYYGNKNKGKCLKRLYEAVRRLKIDFEIYSHNYGDSHNHSLGWLVRLLCGCQPML